MKLGFDARMYGLEHAGIGRYVMNLLDRLVEQPDLELILFIPPQHAVKFAGLKQVQVVETSIRHYSLQEQTKFLSLLNHYQFDLLHVPHFNLPYFYHRPFITTIHDILWHQVRGADVTTLSPLKYYLKYQGYRLTVAHTISRAQAILVPSAYVKHDLLTTFPRVNPKKIHVTYEGVSLMARPPHPNRPPRPYLLYIGSAYPHKNLSIILQALTQLDMSLKIAGSRTIFLDRIKHQAESLGILHKVEFLGPVPDSELVNLLGHATALVHPSKSEGFGLTGLEAMAAGCPVIAARATALPEIYAKAALFFDPDNPADLITQIDTLTHNPKLRQELIAKGASRVKDFSWDKMVTQTVQIYHTLIHGH